MAIISSGVWDIDPTVTDGTQLAGYLNELVKAINTNQSSATRPPMIKKGGLWTKTLSGSDIAVMVYDGTTDYEIGKIVGGDIQLDSIWKEVGDEAVYNGDIKVNGHTVGRGGGNIDTNVSLGLRTLAANTTGTTNTAIGHNAMQLSRTSSDSTAVGVNACNSSTLGSYNTGIGRDTLANTSGTSNTAIGRIAGKTLTTGSNNTFIGQNAQPSSATVSNQIVLGDDKVTTVRMGNGDLIYPTSGGLKGGTPVGMIGAFATPYSQHISGWIHCNGGAVSRTQFAKLFAAIGTSYGAGNGSTTFNVPNLIGKFVRGSSGSREVGSLQAEAVKSHTHEFNHRHNADHWHYLPRWSSAGAKSVGFNYYTDSTESVFQAIGNHETTYHPNRTKSNTVITTYAARNFEDACPTSSNTHSGNENRPENIGVNYFIKAYDETGEAVKMVKELSSRLESLEDILFKKGDIKKKSKPMDIDKIMKEEDEKAQRIHEEFQKEPDRIFAEQEAKKEEAFRKEQEALDKALADEILAQEEANKAIEKDRVDIKKKKK